MKFKTACQDHQAWNNTVKCLFQGHNRMSRASFEPRPSQSQPRPSKASTTLLTR